MRLILTTPFGCDVSVGVQEMLECLCKLLSTTGKKLEELADVRPTSFLISDHLFSTRAQSSCCA
jgi:hypothetical protein